MEKVGAQTRLSLWQTEKMGAHTASSLWQMGKMGTHTRSSLWQMEEVGAPTALSLWQTEKVGAHRSSSLWQMGQVGAHRALSLGQIETVGALWCLKSNFTLFLKGRQLTHITVWVKILILLYSHMCKQDLQNYAWWYLSSRFLLLWLWPWAAFANHCSVLNFWTFLFAICVLQIYAFVNVCVHDLLKLIHEKAQTKITPWNRVSAAFSPKCQSRHIVTTSVEALFWQMCTGVMWKVANGKKILWNCVNAAFSPWTPITS